MKSLGNQPYLKRKFYTEIFQFLLKQESIGSSVQLQRIISRCKCQFFYAHYGEVDPSTLPEVPLPVSND